MGDIAVSALEQIVLTGLIVDDAFCAKALPILKPRHFSVRFTEMVYSWVQDYYNKFGKAPKKTIQDIYTEQVDAGIIDSGTLDLVGVFLSHISAKFEDDNTVLDVQYYLSRFQDFIRRRELQNTKESLDLALQSADIDEAERAVSAYAAPTVQDTEFLQLTGNAKEFIGTLRAAFAESVEESMLHLPGDIGRLLGPMQRGDLVAVAAPAKRGKSWWMQEFAILAAMQGKKAIFFSLEMSKIQVVKRVAARITNASYYPKKFQQAYFDDGYIQLRDVEVKTGLCAYPDDYMLRIFNHLGRGGGDLVVQSYPAMAASVEDIRGFVNYMESAHNYHADVIVVDYADIVQPGRGTSEYRHQIDSVWKMLRSLAQEKNALVITATHTNKNTFKRRITQADLSEDTRKLNHVACMFGLNQSAQEKKHGIMRVNVIASRHDGFSPNDECVVLQSLDIGCPIMSSLLLENVMNIDEFGG